MWLFRLAGRLVRIDPSDLLTQSSLQDILELISHIVG
jgi:hypothetical protein